MKHSDKGARRLLFWGYFWRYGIIGVALLLPFVSYIIISGIGMLEECVYVVVLSFALPLIAMGVDYILASILKWPHILLVDQSAGHRKMNPYDLDWGDFSVEEFVGIGVIFLVLGIVLSIMPLFGWL